MHIEVANFVQGAVKVQRTMWIGIIHQNCCWSGTCSTQAFNNLIEGALLISTEAPTDSALCQAFCYWVFVGKKFDVIIYWCILFDILDLELFLLMLVT